MEKDRGDKGSGEKDRGQGPGPMIARILLGLVFLVFGINLFVPFMPKPPTPIPHAAMAFLGALMATGYMMRLVATTQVLVGLLLVTNRFVPLALVMIAPVIVNIMLFHLVLDLPGIAPGGVVTVLEIYLVWVYRGSFSHLLVARAMPTARAER